ncbi:3-oxoacid CoA-transferase subunit A, partial [Acinetobacter baumannii]
MINKITSDIEPILKAIPDGATIMTGGFGVTGQPAELIEALIDLGKKELTIVNNNAASGDRGLTNLIIAGCVKKMICSFPKSAGSTVFQDLYRAGKIELELVPQGNLACRIQAAGAGLGAIFTPTGYGTKVAEGK